MIFATMGTGVPEKTGGKRFFYDRHEKNSRQNSPVVGDDRIELLFYYQTRAASR